MYFTTRMNGPLQVIDMEREFTAQAGEVFRDEIDKMLKKDQVFIAVNLSNIDYLNSLSLGILLAKMRRCREKGGDLYILNVAEKIKNIFRLTKLDHIIKLLNSEEDAIEEINKIKGGGDES